MADTGTLFVEHQQAVFRYLCRSIGHADAARDLTQEVFLRVSRTRVPDADAAGLRAWVFTIARNLALNHVRDRRPRETPVAHVSAEPAVQELSVAIAQALGALDDADRDVFLLREAGGLSYQEIAAACGLTVEAVRTRLHRARLQLREALDGPLRVHRLRPVGLRAGHRGETGERS